MSATNKTLVCVAGQLRAGRVTWDSFRRHVLDALGADLAVCDHGDFAPGLETAFWGLASHRFRGSWCEDYAQAIDAAADEIVPDTEPRPDWRHVDAIPGNWFGGIRSLPPRRGAGAISIYKRWYLLNMLREHGCLERYERFVVTRSDFLWLAPHPPLDVLRKDRLWIPEGEDWGGVNDRHAILDVASLATYLDGLTPIVTAPQALTEAAPPAGWNAEQYLRWRLATSGVLAHVRRFPGVMFLVREPEGPTDWSIGEWDARRRVFVKMPAERQIAETQATVLATREAWLGCIGDRVADADVRIRARLCAVKGGWSPMRSLFRRRSRLPRRRAIDTGIVVTVCGDALVLHTADSRHSFTEAQVRGAWHLCPPGLEGCCVLYDEAFYVERGTAILSATRSGACRFRELPGGRATSPVWRLARLVMRVFGLSLFCLRAVESPNGAKDSAE